MSSTSLPDARSSDLLLVLNLESRSWKCSGTDRFETLNFGPLMLLSFSAISSQTFLSQLFEVFSWTARSTRSPGIKLHHVCRTTPWCLTCMTTNFYSAIGQMFWINYNFQVQSHFILYTLDSYLFWKSDNCKKKRGYYDDKLIHFWPWRELRYSSFTKRSKFLLTGKKTEQNENCQCDPKSIR